VLTLLSRSCSASKRDQSRSSNAARGGADQPESHLWVRRYTLPLALNALVDLFPWTATDFGALMPRRTWSPFTSRTETDDQRVRTVSTCSNLTFRF
jgi:hypothetical protein